MSIQATISLNSMQKTINRGMKKLDSYLAKKAEIPTKITYTDKSGKKRRELSYSSGRRVKIK